jgi:hypothetical protein
VQVWFGQCDLLMPMLANVVIYQGEVVKLI